jgi:hypothetical protein
MVVTKKMGAGEKRAAARASEHQDRHGGYGDLQWHQCSDLHGRIPPRRVFLPMLKQDSGDLFRFLMLKSRPVPLSVVMDLTGVVVNVCKGG